jgi:small GTP-binding protein
MIVTIMDKNQLLTQLMQNFLNISKFLKSAFIYDRDGLLISSTASGLEKGSSVDFLGAIAGVMDSVLNRIGKEYKMGKYASGSFEVEDQRIFFAEAGKNAIFICTSDFELTINDLLPYIFLVAEKVSRITNNNLYEGFTLNVPDLAIENTFSPPVEIKNCEQESVDIHIQGDGYKIVNFVAPSVKVIRYKLVIMGEGSVGKTSLIDRFAHEKFTKDYLPTLGISITEQEYQLVCAEGSKVQFVIWDLAGQKFFQRTRKAYMSGAKAAFLVFDLTNKESFEQIYNWHNELGQDAARIPCILIGNKKDLVDKRQVPEEEAKMVAKKLKCSYIETSAFTGENVREAFQILGIGLFFLKPKGSEEEDKKKQDEIKSQMEIFKKKMGK